MEHDPVCGMEIMEIIKAEATVYKGRTYYFCTPLCKIQFEQDPEKYIKNNEDDHTHHHN